MIQITPLSGFRNKTTFTFQDTSNSESAFVSWGDGSFSHNSSATHVFSEKGMYSSFGGNALETSAFNLSVYSGTYFQDRLVVERSALSSLVTLPFTFSIYLSSTNQYNTVHLYASGSQSSPYISDRNLWSHLNPEWEFLYNDLSVFSVPVSGEPIFENSEVIGYSGKSVVKFKDDLPGNPILFFTLDKKEENIPLNSRVYAAFSHSICAVNPDRLYITADGINPLKTIQWADKEIPVVISVGSSQLSSSNILHYVSGGISSAKLYSNCYLGNLNSLSYNFSTINLFDENCFSTGGYILSTFSYPSSALNNIEITNNLNSCNQNYETLEFYKTRKTPENVILSAFGVFNYNNRTFILSGISNNFNILAFENRHEFFRKGEDYTVYDIIKESLPFELNEFPNFDLYLSSIAGSGDSLGKVYDKISNFDKDHSDIDLCTPENIIDKYKKLDESIEDFGLEMPEELKRLFHFSSIPLQKLIGTRCSCNTNFVNCANCQNSNVCRICKFDKRSNLGSQINLDDKISEGETILYKENNSENFNFLNVESQEKSSYLLRELSSTYINQMGIENFCFYRWNKTPQNNPIQSVVNFKDSRNLLNPGLSSNSDWYKDEGILEEIFNYVLTKNLI